MRAGVLADRDTGLVVGAVGLSALGDFLALVPLALHVQEASGSAVQVAMLFVALWAPVVLLAGPAGLLVDRYETRGLLVVASLAQAVVAVALAFAESMTAVLVLAALLGVGFAVAQPAEFALIPAIAPADRLVAVNAWVETARYGGMTIGPVLGGLVSAAAGTRPALLADAATFVVVAGAAAALRARRPPRRADDPEAGGERARDGFVFLFREPVLAVVVGTAFVSLLFMSASISAEVFFAKDFLDVGDAGYGALVGAWTLGMALGALVFAPRLARRTALATAALAAIVVQSVGLGLPTLWLALGLALGSWLVGGIGHGAKNVLVRTLMQERTPERLHGRVFAAYNGLRNGAELVALIAGGVLVAAIGARWTLLLAGAVPAAAAAAALVLSRGRLRAAAAATAGGR